MTEITADTFKAQVHATFPNIDWQTNVHAWTLGKNPHSYRLTSEDNLLSVTYHAFQMTFEVGFSYFFRSEEHDNIDHAKNDLIVRLRKHIEPTITVLAKLTA